MLTLFLACAALGGIVLVLQLAMGLLGLEHGHGESDLHLEDGSVDDPATDGLNLFSVRAISAGVAFFGIGGAGALSGGLGRVGAFGVAVALGLGAMLAVAALMRSILRLEDDRTLRIERAVGLPARVYIRIPGQKEGVGKVMLTLQDRIVELQAVTPAEALPTGADVTVVDVVAPDTVEVVATPLIGDV